jgi:hypothetical protein
MRIAIVLLTLSFAGCACSCPPSQKEVPLQAQAGNESGPGETHHPGPGVVTADPDVETKEFSGSFTLLHLSGTDGGKCDISEVFVFLVRGPKPDDSSKKRTYATVAFKATANGLFSPGPDNNRGVPCTLELKSGSGGTIVTRALKSVVVTCSGPAHYSVTTEQEDFDPDLFNVIKSVTLRFDPARWQRCP